MFTKIVFHSDWLYWFTPFPIIPMNIYFILSTFIVYHNEPYYGQIH